MKKFEINEYLKDNKNAMINNNKENEEFKDEANENVKQEKNIIKLFESI